MSSPAPVRATSSRSTWRRHHIYPRQSVHRLVTDVIACARSTCRLEPISISGYHISGRRERRRPGDRVHSPTPRIRARRPRGWARSGQFGGASLFSLFACHSDFLEEVAKFRAARRLWARLMKESLGASNPKAQHLRFHVQTGGVTLTAQQPDNNVVRVALQALAAVLGGCQSLHTNGKDEALALPTERGSAGPARSR